MNSEYELNMPGNDNDLNSLNGDDYNHHIADDMSSVDDNSTVNSQRKKQRKIADDIKKSDSGYNKVFRNVNGKRSSIEFYATSTRPGMYIRDAVTGSRYDKFLVGTRNEHQFFKVQYCGNGVGKTTREPATLFYFSPEQYERHMNVTVSPDIKEKWTTTFAKICRENQ